MPVANKFAKAAKAAQKPKAPLWSGPESTSPDGGITFSLLSRWLYDRERFRLYVMEGLAPKPAFNHRLFYGDCWHICEEALAREKQHFGEVVGTTLQEDNLRDYAQKTCAKFPLKQQEIEHWYNVCRVQFPIYCEYWRNNPDVQERTPVLQEESFNVPYQLPSGRHVILRGKFDAVDVIGKGKESALYLQENKTKGDIEEEILRRQLESGFDLQTMIYMTALTQDTGIEPLESVKQYAGRDAKKFKTPINGIRYNVIRRPLSGGKGTIKRHEPTKSKPDGESVEDYYGRVRSVIDGTGIDSKGNKYPGPPYFFMRWKIEINAADLHRFQVQSLNPILENLCDWWSRIKTGVDPFSADALYRHWLTPSGVWNPLEGGGATEYDEFLATGSMAGMDRIDNLFPELS